MVVSGRAQQGGQSWVLRCFNVYADDCQMGDVFHDHQELDQLLENINTTLHLLQQFGLTINPAKCTALLTMGGTSHRKVRARCTTQTPLWIPIAATAKNLGTTIFYKHMEDHTVKHRLRLARIAFGRLQRWLTGPRGLKKSNRVQLFSTCVFPVLTWHFCKWHHATWPAEHPKNNVLYVTQNPLQSCLHYRTDASTSTCPEPCCASTCMVVESAAECLQRSILNRLTHAFDTDIIHQLDSAHLTELITWFSSPTNTGADVLIIPEVTDVTHLRTDLICHKCGFLNNDVSHFIVPLHMANPCTDASM